MTGSFNPACARLATLIYTGADYFQRMCEDELNFSHWRKAVRARLSSHGMSVSEDELKWLQSCLATESGLKDTMRRARERLNERLEREPALLAGAVIALFMDCHIDESQSILRATDLGEPTALIELMEPLHFACHRGDIFQILEAPVVARMKVSKIPGGLGKPAEEAVRFVLKSPKDIGLDGASIRLAYPSLNKVVPGILSRLHMGEGKQNTNRSIYYHAAYLTQSSGDRPEFISLWSIRDGVIEQTWRCPSVLGPHSDAGIKNEPSA